MWCIYRRFYSVLKMKKSEIFAPKESTSFFSVEFYLEGNVVFDHSYLEQSRHAKGTNCKLFARKTKLKSVQTRLATLSLTLMLAVSAAHRSSYSILLLISFLYCDFCKMAQFKKPLQRCQDDVDTTSDFTYPLMVLHQSIRMLCKINFFLRKYVRWKRISLIVHGFLNLVH